MARNKVTTSTTIENVMSETTGQEPTPASALDTTSPTELEAVAVPTPRVDMMIDLETLSTEKNAQILSVGIVLFDPFGEPGASVEEHHWPMELVQEEGVSSMYRPNAGRHISLDTVMWWFGQPEAAAAQLKLRQERPAYDHNDVILDLRDILARNVVECVWGNSPGFDLDILGSMAGKWWNHSQERDYRTLKAELGHLIELPERTGAHDALEDAKYQARVIQMIMRAVRG